MNMVFLQSLWEQIGGPIDAVLLGGPRLLRIAIKTVDQDDIDLGVRVSVYSRQVVARERPGGQFLYQCQMPRDPVEGALAYLCTLDEIDARRKRTDLKTGTLDPTEDALA